MNAFLPFDISTKFLRIYKNKTRNYTIYYKNFAFGFREIQRQKERHKRDSVFDCHFSTPAVTGWL